jgi:hypothetical protein
MKRIPSVEALNGARQPAAAVWSSLRLPVRQYVRGSLQDLSGCMGSVRRVAHMTRHLSSKSLQVGVSVGFLCAVGTSNRADASARRDAAATLKTNLLVLRACVRACLQRLSAMSSGGSSAAVAAAVLGRAGSDDKLTFDLDWRPALRCVLRGWCGQWRGSCSSSSSCVLPPIP